MKSVLAYVRSLLGWPDEEITPRSTFKRERTEDDFGLDGFPSLKRSRPFQRSPFLNDIQMEDDWSSIRKANSKVRYVPIQVDPGHPCTSTPKYMMGTQSASSQVRKVPVKYTMDSDPSVSYVRKPRIHTPIRQEVIIDDDDDDDEVTWVETRPEKPVRKPTKNIYVEVENHKNGGNESDDNDDDVVFVKKIATPKEKPYHILVPTNNDDDDDEDNSRQTYKAIKKFSDRYTLNRSPKPTSKFKLPPGITKSYRKTAPFYSKYMIPANASNITQARNKFTHKNGSIRSAISEAFNLDEKKSYQDLIQRVSKITTPVNLSSNPNVIKIAEEAASFHSTQQSQKKALAEINLVERGLKADREYQSNNEYDPITVASLNSSDSEIEVVPSGSSTTSSSIRIRPLNSLKDSHKDSAITSQDWLTNFNNKYQKKLTETRQKLKDVQLESDIITKINHRKQIALLEHKLKNDLSIPLVDSLTEEKPAAVELPKLTPEQEKLVNRALGPGPPDQLIVEKFNLRIHRRDLQTLCGLNWLNDEVINFYMNLIMERSQQKSDLPKVYATNTFFYPKLMQSGQAGLRRWTRKVDIFAHALMVIPVHLGVHWCVSLIDFREKKISYLDSMGGRNQGCLVALLQYLRDEHQDKKGAKFDDHGWKTECLKDIPQQMNGSDCGMFSCTFAEFAARNAPFTFTQAHMPYLRRKAALEIIQGKLLL